VQLGEAPSSPSSPLQITDRVWSVCTAPHVVLHPRKSRANQSYLTHAGVALQFKLDDGLMHFLEVPDPVHSPTPLLAQSESSAELALAFFSVVFFWHWYASETVLAFWSHVLSHVRGLHVGHTAFRLAYE
jgi:hypothetical protein